MKVLLFLTLLQCQTTFSHNGGTEMAHGNFAGRGSRVKKPGRTTKPVQKPSKNHKPNKQELQRPNKNQPAKKSPKPSNKNPPNKQPNKKPSNKNPPNKNPPNRNPPNKKPPNKKPPTKKPPNKKPPIKNLADTKPTNKKPTGSNRIVLKRMTRQKAPKPMATRAQVNEDDDRHKPSWQFDDAFYPKDFLRLLASNGVDVSGFQPIPGKIPEGTDKAVVNVKPWFKWNHIDETDGKIIVPYTFHANFPWRDEVNAAVADMNEDIGCMKLVLVPNDQISSTDAPFSTGIIIAFEDITGNGCYSAIGIAPGFIGRASISAITDFGVPSFWQLLSLGGMENSGCRGWEKSTIKHEFMHAMGIHHEHNRPDRETFLIVDMDATDVDHNFELMTTGGASDWNTWVQITDSDGNDRFPYETVSVMHYCSYCGSNGNLPVMTYQDGSVFDSGAHMTTTDSLQLAAFYCQDRADYVEKEHVVCNSVDKFGFIRPVFNDRICDNVKDCTDGQDESEDVTSALAQCLPEERLPTGCCKSYMVDGEEFEQAGKLNGIDAFVSLTDTNKWLVRLLVSGINQWFLTVSGLPSAGNAFSWSAFSDTQSVCPPSDGSFVDNWRGYQVWVQCKFNGAVFNGNNECTDGSHTCDANAICADAFSGFTCTCKSGFSGDGHQCTEIILINECETGAHNCDEDATCTDTETSFTCSCNEGMIDTSTELDGTSCQPVPPCCKSFTIGIENPTELGTTLPNYNAVCTSARTQENGWVDYQCIQNPSFGDQSWVANTLVIQYGWVGGPEWEKYWVFESETGLLSENNNVWPQFWGTQARPLTDEPKCVDLNNWDSGDGAGYKMLCTCLEWELTEEVNECETESHTCHTSASCSDETFGFSCQCNEGFAGDGFECTFIQNECELGTHRCHENAFCGDTLEGFTCICDDGFDGDGFIDGTGCIQVDIDECALGNHLCDHNCQNVEGSFSCSCDEGWIRDPATVGTCLDIDECSDGTDNCLIPDGNMADCINTAGSFHCTCMAGFETHNDDSILCHNINECTVLNEPCFSHSTCEDTEGSFVCNCDEGFQASRQEGRFFQMLSKIEGKFHKLEKDVCIDINECDGDPCLLDSNNPSSCANTVGSFSCICLAGFEPDEEGSIICVDTDECAQNANLCGPNSVCINNDGGFECSCQDGYEVLLASSGSFAGCSNIDECNVSPNDNPCKTDGNNANCFDNDGGFLCVCQEGYSGEVGVSSLNTCTNIDECAEIPGTCLLSDGNPVTCIDTDGSFECICHDGFTPDDIGWCSDNNECLNDPCGIASGNQALCSNNAGGFTCHCMAGWEASQLTNPGPDNPCQNINECADLTTCQIDTGNEALCTDTAGSFICECNPGFIMDQEGLCIDIDECGKNEICPEHSACLNTIGSFECNCEWGLEMAQGECVDIDECHNDPCLILGGNMAVCTNNFASFDCSCQDGFEQMDSSFECNDIDECITIGCGKNSTCDNTLGSFECGCVEGFTRLTSRSESFCENIDECSDSPCDLNAFCTDTEGNFECECNQGYQGDGFTCDDIDECVLDVCFAQFGENTICANTNGNFNCSCIDGFSMTSKGCVDVDECFTDPCSASTGNPATCINLHGSFDCECNDGFQSANDLSFQCVNINECEVADPCGITVGNPSICIDTEGGVECACQDGFSEFGEFPKLDVAFECVDDDECFNENHNCHLHATCINTQGGFNCQCKFGFEGDGVECGDINECLTQDPCFILAANPAICTNTEGGHECTCQNGYKPIGDDELPVGSIFETCLNYNECAEAQETDFDLCGPHSTCTDTDGSYECGCVDGYEMFTGSEGSICVDIDECPPAVHPDDDPCGGYPATCDNTEGGFTCSCREGFFGELGINSMAICEDIDECVHDPCNINIGNMAECLNNWGSFWCRCLAGHEMDSVGDCSEINECEEDPCHIATGNPATCINLPHYFACECHPGYEEDPMSPIAGICRNIDECTDENTCSIASGNPAHCVDTDGGFQCHCHEGYVISLDGSCNDVDECASLSSPCPSDASCVNVVGSFECPCKWGFEKADDGSCMDKDECTMGDPCRIAAGNNAECLNTHGSFECLCQNGFIDVSDELGLVECADVDECLQNENICGDNAICENVEGNFRCLCVQGYEMIVDASNLAVCVNIDECASDENPCQVNGNQAFCTDTVGGFNCSCNDGYSGAEGINEPNSCSDIDECQKFVNEDICGIAVSGNQATCVNTDGGYECLCLDGFANFGLVFGFVSCFDIDECLDEPCETENSECLNTHGSYECGCLSGYEFDTSGVCVEKNECNKPETCALNQGNAVTCTNLNSPLTPGHYSCICDDGYLMNAETGWCDDVDECIILQNQFRFFIRGRTSAICSDTANCINTMGSYFCECIPGYEVQETPIGHLCLDINECDQVGICGHGSVCTNLPATYTCNCDAGFTYNEETGECQEIKPCDAEVTISVCGVHSTCLTVDNEIVCGCQSGFVSDGNFCVDVDECVSPVCQENAFCINTPGSFECDCGSGYIMADGICENINECAWVFGGLDPCTFSDENSSCFDTDGGYNCLCDEGFEGPIGQSAATTCSDIDECLEGPDHTGCGHFCQNTIGSYECLTTSTSTTTTTTTLVDMCAFFPCEDGYECISTRGTRTTTACIDIDECESGTHDCPEESICHNTPGIYVCEFLTTWGGTTTGGPAPLCWVDVPNQCQPGFFCENGQGCSDIDECETGTHNCDAVMDCVNTRGSHECHFDSNLCSNIDLQVSWKGAKYTLPKFIGGSQDTVKVMVIVFNNEDDIDIRQSPYKGFLMWGKNNCGKDFGNALEDGRLTFDILDYESYYSHDLSAYTRIDRSLTGTIIQFNQETTGDKDMPWNRKTGNSSTKDQFELIISGLNSVTIPDKFTLMDCLMSASVGVYVSHDTTLKVKNESILKCAAWGRDIY